MQSKVQVLKLSALIRFITSLLLLNFLFSCQETINSKTDSTFELSSDIDSIVGKQFSGIILIDIDGKQKYAKSFGYSNIKDSIALKLNDSFVIGSISKQITAALIMKDVEAGFIKLNDPIGKYLNNIQLTWKDSVTIHHLLVHTSGVTSLDAELSQPAGNRFEYSQFGYQLLAEVIESVHHNSFENVANIFFTTKGLKNTHYPTYISDEHVGGYELLNPSATNHFGNSTENYPAAGSFISTANDLVKWNYLLHQGKIISKPGIELMSKHHETRQHPIFGTINYGYGLTFLEGESSKCIGALGYAPGFASLNYYFPETKTSVVVLNNVIAGLPDFNSVFDKHLQILNLVKQDQMN